MLHVTAGLLKLGQWLSHLLTLTVSPFLTALLHLWNALCRGVPPTTRKQFKNDCAGTGCLFANEILNLRSSKNISKDSYVDYVDLAELSTSCSDSPLSPLRPAPLWQRRARARQRRSDHSALQIPASPDDGPWIWCESVGICGSIPGLETRWARSTS